MREFTFPIRREDDLIELVMIAMIPHFKETIWVVNRQSVKKSDWKALSKHLNYKIHMTDYFTLSHLSFSIWKGNLDKKIWIEKAKEDKYPFIRESIYGGRTYPTKKT